ncbi:MAG: hypothetical protein LC796_07800 [Acidobacteria bacterium]|nr:hypothetical protein [Acidobacteriota bacterium]
MERDRRAVSPEVAGRQPAPARRDHGLLVRRREGRQHIYRLSLQSLALVREWIRWHEAGKR